MGKPTGFLEYERRAMPSRDPAVRINDFYEIYARADDHTLKEQGARCMDCGIPFCLADPGCPIDNLIPEWNDLVYHNRWREAYERLTRTNNFPEWTGRICPAPCESACVLGIIEPPVTIKSIECAIIDRAFDEGWVRPIVPAQRTGKRVAVVGSGPAGLAAADQLNKAGHAVTVFERDDRLGGLLMYGVPNMKLDKRNVDRRVDLLRDSGIEFRVNAHVGGPPDDPTSIDPDQLRRDYDAILLACGALQGRDLDLPGRQLRGVHMAMDYLTGVTRAYLDSGGTFDGQEGRYLDAGGKDVVVIGGGDTGADCIGTALRQGCRSLLNITRRDVPPTERDADHPWPQPPETYFLDYSHAEGAARFGRDPREFAVLPLEFVDDGRGRVAAVRIERLKWEKRDGRLTRHRTGIIEDLPAQLVFLSVGFTGHDAHPLTEALGVREQAGLVHADYGRFHTNVDSVFVAGDMRRGASLIVWAIAEGRGAAHAIDAHLMGSSLLPAPGMQTGLPSSAG